MHILLYRGEQFDSNFYYHAGVDIDHSFLLVETGRKTLFVSKLNESLARASFQGHVVLYDDIFAELSKYLKNKTILFDGASVSSKMAERLRKLCKLKDHSIELLRLRAMKKKNEVRKIQRAVIHTKNIFDSLDFKSAKTELDLKKQILLATIELGLEPAFEPIVSTDKNTSYPHYSAGNKKLGSLVLVDYGVKYEHYCSDLTRCFILDGDKKKKKQYETLKSICHSIADALPDMQYGKDIANLSAKLIENSGFPKMIHSIGHGVGLDIHELPRLGVKSEDRIAQSILAIEPAFYLKLYGMRYEETLYFDGRKARIL